MVPRCDNCCDMLWLEQRRTNSLGRAGCCYCLTLGTCVRTQGTGPGPCWVQTNGATWGQTDPGGLRRVTHIGAILGQGLRQVLKEANTTCVKSVRSLCRTEMSLYQHKSTHCHFQQISGFVDGGEEGYQSVWFLGQGLPSLGLGCTWLWLSVGLEPGLVYGWCRVDTILSEECKQIHNMPITTPGLDETREDNCWDERGLGNTGTWWAGWAVQAVRHWMRKLVIWDTVSVGGEYS